ncbi:hypothetical protein F5887DRAFT_1062083 [Amanita rubescens]|nr:hypothetical protein F5887DRAFT_1062083 [Amanita rubescens]
MKLAVVGGGPSALYVTSRLFSLLKHDPDIRVHVYDRLWSPYGLVRYGVAPDHPEVKNCTHKFDQTAQDSRFRFFGNVDVVPSSSLSAKASSRLNHTLKVPLSSLLPHYTHLLLSTGCTIPTLHPTIAPSDYCIPALSLVHWYTCHPSKPSAPPIDKSQHVSIIGAGNVSLDIARMLLTSPSLLSKHDVPEHVLKALRRSAVKHVSILARRGPLEAAFTAKELREMMNIVGVSMQPISPDLLAPLSGAELTRQQGRILDILKKGSKERHGSTEKTWSLDFFPRTKADNLPLKLTLNHTTLDSTTRKPVPTGITSEHRTSLVITSLGFQADPSSSPFYDPELRRLKTLPGGRVIDGENGRLIKNVYGSGWASGGAKGVLASTMMDAYNVAGTITEVEREPLEIMNPSSLPDSLPLEIAHGLEGRNIVGFEDWKKVDEEETKRGQAIGKDRERMGWEEVKSYLGLASAAKWKPVFPDRHYGTARNATSFTDGIYVAPGTTKCSFADYFWI